MGRDLPRVLAAGKIPGSKCRKVQENLSRRRNKVREENPRSAKGQVIQDSCRMQIPIFPSSLTLQIPFGSRIPMGCAGARPNPRGFPGFLWLPHLWKFSRPGFQGLGAPWDRGMGFKEAWNAHPNHSVIPGPEISLEQKELGTTPCDFPGDSQTSVSGSTGGTLGFQEILERRRALQRSMKFQVCHGIRELPKVILTPIPAHIWIPAWGHPQNSGFLMTL